MDTRQLRYFTTVAELRSFTKAARRLRVAQPAVSRQVKKLEHDLGNDLLVRAGTGLELTPAGSLLYERARDVLQQLEQIRHEVQAQSRHPHGVVSIGVPPAGGLLLPPVLEAAKTNFPGVSIQVYEDIAHVMTERLLSRQLSIGLLYDPVPHRELHSEGLMIEPIHIFGTKTSRCSDPRPITIQEMATLPLIVPQYPHNVRVLIEDAAAEAHVKLNVIHEVASVGVIRALVHRGIGYGVLTAVTVQLDPHRSELATQRLEWPGMSMVLSIVMRRELTKSRTLQEIARLIRNEAKSALSRGAWPSAAVSMVD